MSWDPQILWIGIFLRLPLSTTIKPYLQCCYHNLIITSSSLFFYGLPNYRLAIASGPRFLLSWSTLGVRDITLAASLSLTKLAPWATIYLWFTYYILIPFIKSKYKLNSYFILYPTGSLSFKQLTTINMYYSYTFPKL